ncbi:hypothetical protein SAMN02910456_00228 [Ruminococcaceae bacterium YRB3002]|nr:hypothetical protein SAMN02910456_00228 [Ruminococcaceae bacterium YRB3002]
MNNKYHDVMGHIEVSDEMRDRILKNIEAEQISPGKGGIRPVSRQNRARISTIIGIVAAAGILVTIGGVFLSKGRLNETKSATPEMQSVHGQYNEAVTGGINKNFDSVGNDSEETVAAVEEHEYSEEDSADNYTSDNYYAALGPSAGGNSFNDVTEVRLADYLGTTYTIKDMSVIADLFALLGSGVPTEEVSMNDPILVQIFADGKILNVHIDDNLYLIDHTCYRVGSVPSLREEVIKLFLDNGDRS